jgi:predicted negative regulator of RcsB-dependent stress response
MSISQGSEPQVGAGVQPAQHEDTERLRAELSATTDRARQARLLCELGELAERAGDEIAAARDYLAAFNADPTFREPLEALVRLLERRRSLKNLGRVLEAIVRAAVSPQEKGRALLMRAAYQEDVQEDLEGAMASAREAAALELPPGEAGYAWLVLELLATRTNDATLREEALEQRAARAGDATWAALLVIDLARIAAAGGDTDRALALLERARGLGSAATHTCATLTERLVLADRGIPGTDEERARTEAYAASLELQGTLVLEALANPARGDELGVPAWIRHVEYGIDALLRAADVRRLAGDPARAGQILDRGIEALKDEEAPLLKAALYTARMRVAELVGDTALAARLAELRLEQAKDPGVAAALSLRIAEHAAGQGDAPRALAALSKAASYDPTSAPARALQLDLLGGTDLGALAAELEGLAEVLGTDDAKGRAFLLAAYCWAAGARDVDAAKAALGQAGLSGVDPAALARVGRALAVVCGDAGWFDETTRRLVQTAPESDEAAALLFDLARRRMARGDTEGGAKALAELGGIPGGEWLGRALLAVLPGHDGTRAQAFEGLAELEADSRLAAGLRLAVRIGAEGAAPTGVAELAAASPADPVLGVLLAEECRRAGDRSAAADAAERLAGHAEDPLLAAAMHVEAGFDRWHTGDRKAALADFERAAEGAPETARLVLGWAARGGVDGSPEARRAAIARALEGGGDAAMLALERFALELGDEAEAESALATLEERADGDLAMAGALARMLWPRGDEQARERALSRVAAMGAAAAELVAAERFRDVRDRDVERAAEAAEHWSDAGGGAAAALEWVAAATALGVPAQELRAHQALARALGGAAGEAIAAGAAVDARLRDPMTPVAPVTGESVPARLANLELASPGSDPRRRASALVGLGDALGADTALDALGLAGWSLLAIGELEQAVEAFRTVLEARDHDLACWEGLRSAGEAAGDAALVGGAARGLGERCADPQRGAAFLEEAAAAFIEAGDDAAADEALALAIARDPKRSSAFDKLFRRVRERKDGDRLLELIAHRLQHTEDPQEIGKLYWEQARVLREKGDQDGALEALRQVTLLEPEHVGALALSGEIFIRRGKFAEAAEKLSTLALLDGAPAKNRVTAGVAAVDLYENKLERPDEAARILMALHRAGLSTLPVRERLARIAARTGRWAEAAEILEKLMEERAEPAGRIEAARLAMVIHRDRLDPAGAAAAVTRLLAEAPADPEAIDLLLTLDVPGKRMMLEPALRLTLGAAQQHGTDAAGAKRIALLARALGDGVLEHAAASAAVALGERDPSLEQALARFEQQKPRTPQVRLPEALLRKVAEGEDATPLGQLFAHLGPTLREAFGPTLDTLGVGKRDKVDPRSGLALRGEIVAWAGAFGIEEIDLYVGGPDPAGVQGVAGEPHALVVGPNVKLPLAPQARARIARELYAMSRGTTVLRSRDENTVASIVIAACRLGDLKVEAPPYAVLPEVEKLMKSAIARKTRKALPELCQAVLAARQDAKTWAHAALASHARVAAVAGGDFGAALADWLAVPYSLTAEARTAALIRFVLSPAYAEVRRALGLEVAP